MVRQGRPMEEGSGYTARELCDGQSLASPGRWESSLRKYPTHSAWESVACHLHEYTHRAGTPELLLRIAVGRVAESPFPEEEVRSLRRRVVDELVSHGNGPRQAGTDRKNVPIDFRLLQSLLDAAGDPEFSGRRVCVRGPCWPRGEIAPASGSPLPQAASGGSLSKRDRVTSWRSTNTELRRGDRTSSLLNGSRTKCSPSWKISLRVGSS